MHAVQPPVSSPTLTLFPWLVLALLGLLGLLGCQGEGTDGCASDEACPGEETCEAGVCVCGSSSACDVGEVCVAEFNGCALDHGGTCAPTTPWTPGTPLFREGTSDWGLEALEVTGTRISAVDVDGDGWPDLLIRQVGGATTEAADGPPRFRYLRNNQRGGFEDLTLESGLVQTRSSEGDNLRRGAEVVAAADVTNNGLLDLYLGLPTHDPALARGETSEIALQVEPNVFVLAPVDANAARFADGVDQPGGASFVDVDGDGWVDLWVPQNTFTPPGGSATWAQDRLLRGRGDGTFEEITLEAGLTTLPPESVEVLNEARAHSRAWSALACDLNQDGVPELLAASYGRAPNHLWRGERREDGSVHFVNRSVASGYAFDDDQTWQDNQFARCYCALVPTAEGCADVGPPSIRCDSPNWQHAFDREPFRLGGNSGTTLCADLGNTGRFDLVTTEIRHWWAGRGSDASEVLRNTGDPEIRFERPGREETGLVLEQPEANWDEGHMTAAVLDVDNNGWLDLLIGASDYPGNRALLFRQVAPFQWEAVEPEDFFLHHRAHGMAVADFNRDGRLDVVIGHSRSRCNPQGAYDCYPTPQVRLFENVGAPGNWLQLRLEGGEGSNRSAIGALVRVTANGVTRTRTVGGGHGHFGMQDDLLVHVGLGAACAAEVEVVWPDREQTTQRFTALANGRLHVRQGDAPMHIGPGQNDNGPTAP